MKNNFLNFDPKEIDKPIYRVFTTQRLFEVFADLKLTLVRPKKWDDPFENFIMNSTGELESGEFFTIDYRDHFYGQCWTKTRESDALWRIYAQKEDGVRVTTTPRKLLKALYDSSGKFKDINSFIGRVEYMTTKEMKRVFDDDTISSMLTDTSGIGQAQTLLFKRTPFKHENEVRIIYNSNGKVNGDLYKFRIDPFDLIDDIVFDPRMKYSVFKKHKDKLISFGFKKRIVKSNLYKAPTLNFKFKSR